MTEPSRSRSGLMRSILASTSAIEGVSASGLSSATSAALAGSTCRISRISCSISASRRLAPSWRSSPRAASARASPTASSARRAALSASARSVSAAASAIGGGAALGGGGFDLADQRLPLAFEFLRRIDQFGAFVRRLVGALRKRGDLRRGIVVAVVPFLALGGDGAQPVIGKLGFARDRLRLAAHFGAGSALARDGRVDRGKLAFDVGGVRQGDERLLLSRRKRARSRRAPAPIRCRASWSAEMRAALRLISRSAAACCSRAASVVCWVSRQRARACVSVAAAAASAASAASTTPRLLSTSARAAVSSLSIVKQPAALGEPPRRAGRRMGGDGKAVPAPEIAFARHQPLARLEHRGQARSFGALDDADLGEAACEFGRRFDIFRQRRDAVRQAADRTDRAPRRPSASGRKSRPAHRDRRPTPRRAPFRSLRSRRWRPSPAARDSCFRPRAACRWSWPRFRAAARSVRRPRAAPARRRSLRGRADARLPRRAPRLPLAASAACALASAAASAAKSGAPLSVAARPASILANSASSRAARSSCSRKAVCN